MRLFPALWAAAMLAAPALAAPVTIRMNAVDASGIRGPIGEVTASASPHGVVFTPSLERLPPGLHGFHLHANASCEAGDEDGRMTAAAAAGGHFDPAKTGRHGFPWGKGHLGDLPALYVAPDGTASHPVLAPRLKLADLPGHALMIHAGGENHSDHPEPLGGGGGRVACGVVPDQG